MTDAKEPKKDGCEFCEGEEGTCPSRSQDGFFCSRKAGHPGDHVACGIRHHQLCRWSQTDVHETHVLGLE